MRDGVSYWKVREVKAPERHGAWTDVYSAVSMVVAPHTTARIPSGLAFHIPAGWEVWFKGRSSLASRGIEAHFGLIDPEFSGHEVQVIIHNMTDESWIVTPEMRIAQFRVLHSDTAMQAQLIDAPDITPGSKRGFGSSGASTH